MKSRITLQDPDKTNIFHIYSSGINHTDLHDYPEYAAKLKKILAIALGNSLDYPYMKVHNFTNQIHDTLMQLNQLNVKYAVFWHDGSWPDGTEFETELEKCVEEWNQTDWLAAGHILAFPGKLPKWHQQCVVVNVKQYAKTGIGYLNGYFDDYPGYTQSSEHHHDDYTPLWINSQEVNIGGDDIDVPITDDGYEPDNILDCLFPNAFANNLMIYNFPQELRDTKKCCYPEDDIEQTMSWLLDKTFPEKLNAEELIDYEVKYINTDKQCLKQYKIMNTEVMYITNTEDVPKHFDMGAEVISVPCSGLHQFRYASGNLRTLKRIVWADFSPLGIAWTKKLLAEWDGKNFQQFFYDNRDWIKSLPYSHHPDHIRMLFDPELAVEFVESYGGEQQWLKVWDQIRELQHDFVHVDLMKDWQKLVDAVGKNQTMFLQLSNIWQYEINYINHDIIDAELAFGNLLKNLMINNDKVYFTGDTPADDHYEYTDLSSLPEII